MIRLVGIIIKMIHIFIVLLYLSACFTPFLPAGKFWIFAVIGLVFPFLFVLVSIFFVGCLIGGSKWYLLSLFALICSFQQLSVVFGLNLKKDFNLSKQNNTLRVLDWNVSFWGESNKSKAPINNYAGLISNLFQNQQADVLCFQEFWDTKYGNSRYSTIDALKKIGYPYSFFVKTVRDGKNYNSGVAIVSKYPIIDSAKFIYSDKGSAEHLIYADIIFNKQRVRVITTHLQSVNFQETEYAAIGKIKSRDEAGLKDSKNIIRKLKYAYHHRGGQADFVNQKIKESPYPVIMCGDFNDVPNSYTYFTIRDNLQDAFVKKGTGIGRTFQYLSPTLRIDYLFADKKFKVQQYSRLVVPYSDHFPIIADFEMNTP